MTKTKYEVLMPKTLEQLEGFLQQVLKRSSKNIVVKILDEHVSFSELLLLCNKYETQIKSYKRNKSIVFLSKDFDYEQIPDFISIAPTEEEAVDIIDFEEIERDLSMED